MAAPRDDHGQKTLEVTEKWLQEALKSRDSDVPDDARLLAIQTDGEGSTFTVLFESSEWDEHGEGETYGNVRFADDLDPEESPAEDNTDAESPSQSDASDESDPDDTVTEEPAEDPYSPAQAPPDVGDVITVSDGAGKAAQASYNPDHEPYRLPREAALSNVHFGVLYEAVVINVVEYGFFVALCDTQNRGTRNAISGLVHQSNIGLQKPEDFEVGERVHVTIENLDAAEDGVEMSFVPHNSEDKSSSLFPATHD